MDEPSYLINKQTHKYIQGKIIKIPDKGNEPISPTLLLIYRPLCVLLTLKFLFFCAVKKPKKKNCGVAEFY